MLHYHGKTYDPATKEEVPEYSQLDAERFSGEPIALVQSRIDLQWHGADADLLNEEEWYDRSLERFYAKQ
jgi:hypothetical protein